VGDGLVWFGLVDNGSPIWAIQFDGGGMMFDVYQRAYAYSGYIYKKPFFFAAFMSFPDLTTAVGEVLKNF